MKSSFGFMLELLRIIFIMFLILLAFSAVNTFILQWIGGMAVLDEGNFSMLFFFLQTLGVFLLITVFYRNKLQFSGWFASKQQTRLSPKRTKQFLIGSVIAIVSSYILLVLRMVVFS